MVRQQKKIKLVILRLRRIIASELNPIAYCGLYCGACPKYVDAMENIKNAYCCGCASDVVPRRVERCDVRKCARIKRIKTCALCPEHSSCNTLKEFLNSSVVLTKVVGKNLDEIRSKGLEKWQREQRAQWTCKYCGSPYSWKDRKCRKCHRPVTNWLK